MPPPSAQPAHRLPPHSLHTQSINPRPQIGRHDTRLTGGELASAERGEAGVPPRFGESSGVPLTAPSSGSPAGGRSCGSALCKLKGAGLSGEGERALSSSSASSVIAPAAVTRGPTQAVSALHARQLPLDRDWQACARAEGGRDGSGRRLRPSPAAFHEVQPSALCARGTTPAEPKGEKRKRVLLAWQCVPYEVLIYPLVIALVPVSCSRTTS